MLQYETKYINNDSGKGQEPKESLLNEIATLKEQVQAQQEMLASTTRFLMQTQEKIEVQKKELEQKNTELFDSINYAGFVQEGLFPSESIFRQHFKESFVRLKQRDIIGGDLPFCRKTGKEVVVTAIDCTGHGVSGAMLTAMAHSFLNEILGQSHGGLESVLDVLNKYFLGVFNRDSKTYFGLDIAIVKLNPETNEVEFAGAGRPLLIVSDGRLTKVEKTGVSIGMVADYKYRSKRIKLNPNDVLYMFSDGVTDQLGDRIPKKFTERRLRELLLEIGHLKLKKQNEVIFEIIKSWQGANEQTDDQLMIGLKIK